MNWGRSNHLHWLKLPFCIYLRTVYLQWEIIGAVECIEIYMVCLGKQAQLVKPSVWSHFINHYVNLVQSKILQRYFTPQIELRLLLSCTKLFCLFVSLFLPVVFAACDQVTGLATGAGELRALLASFVVSLSTSSRRLGVDGVILTWDALEKAIVPRWWMEFLGALSPGQPSPGLNQSVHLCLRRIDHLKAQTTKRWRGGRSIATANSAFSLKHTHSAQKLTLPNARLIVQSMGWSARTSACLSGEVVGGAGKHLR